MTPLPETTRETKEGDQIAAPFLFVYIVLVIGWIAAMLAWVYWFRGYA